MAVNAIDAQVLTNVTMLILPMAGFTSLVNSFVRIDLFIGKERASMRVMAGNTGYGEMFGVEKILILLVVKFKTTLGTHFGRIVARMTVAA